VKNTIVADSTRCIVFLGETVEGKRNDKTAEDDASPFPAESRAGADSGYQEGITPTV